MRADKRKQIVKKLVKRDGPGCFYGKQIGLPCGDGLTLEETTLDHYIPLAAGGTWDIRNLRMSCQPCNNRKSNLVPDGTRHPVPKPRPKKKTRAERVQVRQMRVPCNACLNGRRLDQHMICPQCGRLPLPPHRNHLYRSNLGECDHASTWCGMCSIFSELRNGVLVAS